MKAIVRLAGLLLGLPVVAWPGQADSPSPASQYSALFREYSPVSGGIRKAKTDQERKANIEELGSFASRFVELAEQYPKDPVALRSLRQAVQVVGSTDSGAINSWELGNSHYPSGCNDGSAEKIVELVLRDHLQSDQLGPVVDRMRYGYRLVFAKGLSTILKKNPHREVQGLSCLFLAQNLNDRLKAVRLAADRPELTECFDIVFGQDYLPGLRKLDQAKLATRIETLFERAEKDYADVKFRSGTVGETAKQELYDIRHLSVGRVAPDIDGKDQDGKPFKLSDYRGKVVFLYFWSEF